MFRSPTGDMMDGAVSTLPVPSLDYPPVIRSGSSSGSAHGPGSTLQPSSASGASSSSSPRLQHSPRHTPHGTHYATSGAERISTAHPHLDSSMDPLLSYSPVGGRRPHSPYAPIGGRTHSGYGTTASVGSTHNADGATAPNYPSLLEPTKPLPSQRKIRCFVFFGLSLFAIGVVAVCVTTTVMPQIVANRSDAIIKGYYVPSSFDSPSWICNTDWLDYQLFYLYNITNADDVLYRGQEATVDEVGPFAYRRHECKLAVDSSQPNLIRYVPRVWLEPIFTPFSLKESDGTIVNYDPLDANDVELRMYAMPFLSLLHQLTYNPLGNPLIDSFILNCRNSSADALPEKTVMYRYSQRMPKILQQMREMGIATANKLLQPNAADREGAESYYGCESGNLLCCLDAEFRGIAPVFTLNSSLSGINQGLIPQRTAAQFLGLFNEAPRDQFWANVTQSIFKLTPIPEVGTEAMADLTLIQGHRKQLSPAVLARSVSAGLSVKGAGPTMLRPVLPDGLINCSWAYWSNFTQNDDFSALKNRHVQSLHFDYSDWPSLLTYQTWMGLSSLLNESVCHNGKMNVLDFLKPFAGWVETVPFDGMNYLGSSGLFTRPSLSPQSGRASDDSLEFWNDELARPFLFKSSHSVSTDGINAFSYRFSNQNFEKQHNQMYWSNVDGLMNASQIMSYAPLFVSEPHFGRFHNLPPTAQDFTDPPVADPDDSYVDVELNSGLVVNFAHRLQYNVWPPSINFTGTTLSYDLGNNGHESVQPVIVPAVVSSRRLQLSDSIAADLRTIQDTPTIQVDFRLWGAVGGGLITALGVILFVKGMKWRRRVSRAAAQPSVAQRGALGTSGSLLFDSNKH